ncbi:MAG: S41 family peptidase [Acidobacteria bacterium]|nr:S41 family peptidase [Acidobacteriota bacterium]
MDIVHDGGTAMRKGSSIVLLAWLIILMAAPPSARPQQGSVSAVNPPHASPADPGARDDSRAGAGAEAVEKLERDFNEALAAVEANHADGGRMDYTSVFKSAINGMLQSLDPHSKFYDAEDYREWVAHQRFQYCGIGATIGYRGVGERVNTYVIDTFQDSPASRANLRYGDRILEVDGLAAPDKYSNEVRERIRGRCGSVVRLKVERAATGRADSVEITREVMHQPSVPDAYLVRPGVGYVLMNGGFVFTTPDELQAALRFLKERGATSYIIDLRDNRGGHVYEAIRVADMFLPRGQVILSLKGRIGGLSHTYAAANAAPDLSPLVVLINRNTASASEIVVGALQDHDRALVVGENSFGKGLVQNFAVLNEGLGLNITIARYYTPSGRSIQRDYTSVGYYDYLNPSGAAPPEGSSGQERQAGTPARTDSGRAVYGGGGIRPDVAVAPRLVTPEQQRLMDSIFLFTRELVNGRVEGLGAYKIQRPIDYGHLLQPTDFPVGEEVYQSYKRYVTTQAALGVGAARLDEERDFILRRLRYEIVTASYGTVTAMQALESDDPQLKRAIEEIPRAGEFALSFARRYNLH